MHLRELAEEVIETLDFKTRVSSLCESLRRIGESPIDVIERSTHTHQVLADWAYRVNSRLPYMDRDHRSFCDFRERTAEDLLRVIQGVGNTDPGTD